MKTYRITKYNPKKRNASGVFQDLSEWTSVSDIGKAKYNKPTYEAYKIIEDAYVFAITSIMEEQQTGYLIIEKLSNYATHTKLKLSRKKGFLQDLDFDYQKDIASLKDSQKLSGTHLDLIIRLILREEIWMELRNPKFKVSFGYDYYMYISIVAISNVLRSQIESSGLFVE